MHSNPLTTLLAAKGTLLADGATGTTLFQLGLTSGDAPELWNVDEPEKIRALHRGFTDAGADIILSNTFGGTRHRLQLHNAQDRVQELNRRGAELAREIADAAGRPVIVGGSVGPTGELFEPLGLLTHDQAVDSFAEQMRGLKDGGADLAWIETMSAQEEIRAAAEAAIRVGLPYAFTVSFDTAGKSMMGLSPTEIHTVCQDLQVQPIAIGANCGVGAPDILAALLSMKEASHSTAIIIKGNCGIPTFKGTDIVYTGTPKLMARYAQLAMSAGAHIVGGCCGTTKVHLAAMRRAIDEHQTEPVPTLKDITDQLGQLVNTVASPTKKVKPVRRRRSR